MSNDLNTRAHELYDTAELRRRLAAHVCRVLPAGYSAQVTPGARGSDEPPLTVSATGPTNPVTGAVNAAVALGVPRVDAIYGERRANTDSYTRLSPTGVLSKMMGRLFNGTVTGVLVSYAASPRFAKLQLDIEVPCDISLETVQANILKVCQEMKTQTPAAAPGKRRLLKLEEEA